MPASFQIIVVFNRIPALIAFVEAHSTKAVRESADRVVETAKSTVPVVTGHLQGSIGNKVSGKNAEIFATAEYAAYVEYGTYKMAAQPYLAPALMSEWPHFVDQIGPGCFGAF